MRGIGNIIFGIIFIVGGASGKLALIGTNSGGLLVLVGVGLLVWGGYQAMSGGGEEAAPEE